MAQRNGTDSIIASKYVVYKRLVMVRRSACSFILNPALLLFLYILHCVHLLPAAQHVRNNTMYTLHTHTCSPEPFD